LSYVSLGFPVWSFPTWRSESRYRPGDEDWHCPRCDEFLAGYGFYPGGDPRAFDPDPECNSPEEITRWGLACWRAWAYGEDVATSTGWISATIHVCGGWLGTYFWECRCWERELCVGEVAA
jgi:hypothetical protein